MPRSIAKLLLYILLSTLIMLFYANRESCVVRTLQGKEGLQQVTVKLLLASEQRMDQ